MSVKNGEVEIYTSTRVFFTGTFQSRKLDNEIFFDQSDLILTGSVHLFDIFEIYFSYITKSFSSPACKPCRRTGLADYISRYFSIS